MRSFHARETLACLQVVLVCEFGMVRRAWACTPASVKDPACGACPVQLLGNGNTSKPNKRCAVCTHVWADPNKNGPMIQSQKITSTTLTKRSLRFTTPSKSLAFQMIKNRMMAVAPVTKHGPALLANIQARPRRATLPTTGAATIKYKCRRKSKTFATMLGEDENEVDN